MEQKFVPHSPVDHQLNSNKNNGLHNNHTRLITNDEWDPVALWVEIHRLRAEVQGSDGFDSWKDAATAKYRITSVDNDGECEAECIFTSTRNTT